MRFDLVVDGKSNNVELGIGKVVTVTLDGKVFQVEVTNDGHGTNVRLEDKIFKVRVEGSDVWINGHKHRIEIRNPRRVPTSHLYAKASLNEGMKGKTTAGSSRGDEVIYSPLPGSVISIKVKEGDMVKEGSTILVLEAMKMQNEIVSHRDGIVREIRVSEGDLVESGTILAVIGS